MASNTVEPLVLFNQIAAELGETPEGVTDLCRGYGVEPVEDWRGFSALTAKDAGL